MGLCFLSIVRQFYLCLMLVSETGVRTSFVDPPGLYQARHVAPRGIPVTGRDIISSILYSLQTSRLIIVETLGSIVDSQSSYLW